MKKRLLSLLLVIVMVLGMFPMNAMANGSDDAVQVLLSFYDANSNSFVQMPMALTVEPQTAAKYGMTYGNEEYGHLVAENEVTPLDALIKAHETVYGAAFTKDTMWNYLEGYESGSYFTGVFGTKPSNGIGYCVNGKMPDPDVSNIGYAINEYVLKNGDHVCLFGYENMYLSEYVSGFDRTSAEIDPDETLELTLTGCAAMAFGTVVPEPVAGAKLYLLNSDGSVDTGKVLAETDANGKAVISFANPGTYYVTAQGTVEGYDFSGSLVACELIAPYCCVTVTGTAAAETYTVTLPESPVGYTVTAEEGSASPVAEGGSHSFKVSIAEGYEAGEDFMVKANSSELEADDDGVYTISSINAAQVVTVTGVVEETNLAAENVTIIAPAGSTISSGRFYKYFKYDFNSPLKTSTLKDGRLSYIFPVPSSQGFLRVQHPNGVTYWDFDGLSAGSVFEITEEMLFIGSTEYTKDTAYANYEKNGHDTASLYLTVNAQGWLDMDTGDMHSLNVFRNWIPVANSTSNSGVSLPDVTYTVVDINGNPSDVVTVTPDANNSCYADITAAKAGMAVILVTYDAVYNNDGDGGKQFSAIWPENTGVIIVTVGAESGIETNMTVNEEANAGGKQILDVEHDILFYVGDAGAEYSFKPEDGCTVTVARSTVDDDMSFNGFTAEEGSDSPVAEGGSYSFKVAISSGYKAGDDFAVKVNGDALTAVDGVYTISNITANQIITVEGVEKKPVTGTEVDVIWKNFRNSDVNMAITNAKTPISAEDAELKWKVGFLSGSFAAAPSSQIIVDNAIIIMSGKTLQKRSLETGELIASADMSQAPSYGYTPPVYAEGLIICPLGRGTVEAFNAKTLEKAWTFTDALGGQALSPITYANGKVVTGFWISESENANYVCLDVKTGKLNWSYTSAGGFYWAGALAVGDYIVVGTDDASAASNPTTSKLLTFKQTYGETEQVAPVSSLTLTNMGDQRSAIAYANGRLYFTTKAGYLASAAINSSTGVLSDLKSVKYAGQITSTPVVYGDEVYFGLARGGYSVPSNYYNNVVSYVKECGGVLHNRKYTEYSRVILALTAIGKDPTNVGGYDLVAPLNDYDKTIYQGINGPIWALIALDSGNYANDQRQAYIDYILSKEISGGGWALTGSSPDADITGMALQAFAKYQDQSSVKAATDRALSWLSRNQNSDGSFSTIGEENCESTVQVLVGLCELGFSLEDSRFVKNGNTVLDGLMEYYVNGGGFTHILGGGSGEDGMSTEQGFYALVAANRAANSQSSLYRMTSGSPSVSAPSTGNAAFSDIAGHANQKAIEALVAKSIINGMGNGTFAPNKTMTRAEFCTITVKALGLEPKANGSFSDVKSTDWFAGFVGTASDKGIVNGVGGNQFNPNGTITRQEAATMVARAAKVLKLDTGVADASEVLALFSDGAKVASWATDAVAYCAMEGIANWNGSVQPAKAILRCEIAQMIYNLLDAAGKL